jgi:outer membrane immunogenic protein
MTLKFILAGALIAAATPTFAADLAPAPVEPIAPVVVPMNWSGFYIGAEIGYSWTNIDVDFPGTGLETASPDANGVVGGGYVGYNAQFNQIVVGIEADIEATNKSGDRTIATILGPLTADVDNNWQGSVRARLGYAIDTFMPYITGGVAWTDFDVTTSIPGIGSVDNSNTFVGWTIGAGLEYAFTPNIIGRVEYRYTDYGDNDDTLTPFGFSDNVDVKDNTVRVGVAYKF